MSSTMRPFKKGLRSFDAEEADLFFGREQEIEQLINIIVNEQISVMIGPSGCGKSSLINAGLAPRLRSMGYPVIYSFVLDQVTGDVMRALNGALESVSGERADDFDQALEKLYLAGNDLAGASSSTSEDIIVVLATLKNRIIQHFSEDDLKTLCFSIGIDYDSVPGNNKDAKARELIIHARNRNLLKRLLVSCEFERPNVDWQFAQVLNRTERASITTVKKPIILIVDQFEQALFTTHDSKELERFLKDLKFYTRTKRHLVRFIISIRADWLYYLVTEIKHLQLGLNVFANTVTIDYLTRDTAKAAIVGPIDKSGWIYDESVINDILDKLLDSGYEASIEKKYIQPTQLQLVVDSLCTMAEQHGVSALAFTEENYALSGGVEAILKNYLRNQIGTRIDAWRLLARFIVADGKGSRNLKYSELVTVPDQSAVEAEIYDLVQKGLLLIYEKDNQEKYCRLAHDYIAQAVETYIQQNPDQQGWKWAEDWLARGVEDWNSSSTSADIDKPVIEKNRYKHIFEYRNKLKLDLNARRLLIASSMSHGMNGLAYWLSRDETTKPDIDFIASKLCIHNPVLQNAALESLKQGIPNESMDQDAIKPSHVNEIVIQPEVRRQLHRFLAQEFTTSPAPTKIYPARAIRTLREYDSVNERVKVYFVLATNWVKDHRKTLVIYMISVLVIAGLLMSAVFLRSQPTGTWTTIQTLKFGAVPIIAPDPNNPSKLFAIAIGGNHPREGNTLMMWDGEKWNVVSPELGKGFATGLVVSKKTNTSPPRMYFAMRGDGILRSDNDGKTWKSITGGMQSRSISALEIDPSNPDIIFAGTDDWRGVLWTHDGGKTWDFYDSTDDDIVGQQITALAFSNIDGGMLLAGTDAGRILAHKQNSNDWELISNESQGAISAFAMDENRNELYAGTRLGIIFRSQDGGASFERISRISRQFLITSLAIASSKTSQLYLTSYGNGGYTFWRSDDAGEHWEQLDAKGLTRSITLMLLAHQNSIIAATNDGIFESQDEGISWEVMPSEAPLAQTRQVVMPRNALSPVYALSRASVHTNLAGDLKTWEHGKGLRAELVRSVAVDPFNPMTAYAGVMLLGEWSVFVTHDGGHNWSPTNPPNISPLPSDTVALSMSHDGINKLILYAGTVGCGVMRSDDGGQTWNVFGRKQCNETTADFIPSDVSYVSAAWSNPNIVFASSGNSLFVTANGGERWQRLPLPAKAPIISLEVDTVDASIVYVALGVDGLWRSVNGGNSWDRIGQDAFDNAEITSLRAMPDQKGYLLASASNGSVWRSRNSGLTWQSIREQLTANVALSGYSTKLGDGIIAGTEYDGIAVFEPNPIASFLK